MRITEIKATNLDLTDAIKGFLTTKIMRLERFTKRFNPWDVVIVLGKTTERHQKGEIFFAEVAMSIPGEIIHAVVEKDDLYAAIDEVKDSLQRQLVERKEILVQTRSASLTEEELSVNSEEEDDDEEDEEDEEDAPFFGDDSEE